MNNQKWLLSIVQSLVVALLAIIPSSLHAQEDDVPKYKLVAWFNESYSTKMAEIPFSDEPEIKVEGNQVQVKYGDKGLIFTHDDLDKFTLEKIPSVATAVDKSEMASQFHLRANSLTITGTPNAEVGIYDVSGRLIEKKVLNASGETFIDLPSLGKGTFIVRSGKGSFKFFCK